MSNIYTAAYTLKAVAKARPPLAVAAAKKVVFALDFPAEGFLERLVVYQLPEADDGGAPVDFSVELLNSLVPYEPGEYDPAAVPADNLEPYRIQMPPTAPMTALAGDVLSLASNEYGTAWRNLDGGPSDGQRYVYLLIEPDGAIEETQWCVFLQARTAPRV